MADQTPNTNKNRNMFQLFAIALLVVMLINALLVPFTQRKMYKDTDYGTFLEMLEDKEIDTVQYENGEIFFTSTETGKEVVYVTGAWDNDTTIVDKLYDSGAEFKKIVPKQNSPIVNFLLSWVIPFLFIFWMSRRLTRNLTNRMGGSAMSFGESGAKIYAETDHKVTFDDVAGQEEAKEALEEIVDFLHNPGKYTQIGAKLPKGALLVGPPGTGKTLIARAVAGEADVPFFSISGSEFVEMFVGMGAAKVRDLFKQANKQAPCIIFIDEIDTIGKRRGDASFGGHDEREQTLNQLLAEMDGFDSSKGVVLLGATNRPDSLDPALTRPGRFDRRIPMELPDLNGRVAILEVHAKNVNTGPDIDLRKIALATAGASGADLANMINEAALRAVRNGRYAIMQEDLEESVEVVLAGYQRKNAVISPEEKRLVAYHEVGHALVAALQSHAEPLHKITIIPRTSGALGYTMQVAEEERVLMTKEQLLSRLVTLTGGRAAEEVILGVKTSGASNDIKEATRLARSMVTQLGMSDEFGLMALETQSNIYLGGDTALMASEKTAAGIDNVVKEMLSESYAKAKGMISENKEKMHLLAEHLLEKETITGAEFMEILEAPLPEQTPTLAELPKDDSEPVEE